MVISKISRLRFILLLAFFCLSPRIFKTKFIYIFFKENYFFTATEEKAVYFRDFFRAKLPIRYSGRRRSDESTPPLSPTQSDTPPPTQSTQTNFNANALITLTNSHNTATNVVENFENESAENDEFVIDGTQTENETVDESADQEEKTIMPNVELGLADSNVIEAVFDSDDYNNDVSSSSNINRHTLESLQLPAGETAFYDDDGILKIKKVHSNDCESVHIYGKELKPKIPAFEVKVNDIISENIPFKENVRIKLNVDKRYFLF